MNLNSLLLTTLDYYPFGMLLPNRHESSNEYRYGFNGMEKDDEVSGEGNSYTAEYWQYDSRLGRRWNVDPVVKHHESPYATFANNPIWFADPNGADTVNYTSTMLEAGYSEASAVALYSNTYSDFIKSFAFGGENFDIRIEFAVNNVELHNVADGRSRLLYKGLPILESTIIPDGALVSDFTILVEINSDSGGNGIKLQRNANKAEVLIHEILLHSNSQMKFLKQNFIINSGGDVTGVNGSNLKKQYTTFYGADMDHQNLYAYKAYLYNAAADEIIAHYKAIYYPTGIKPKMDRSYFTSGTAGVKSIWPSRERLIIVDDIWAEVQYWEIFYRAFLLGRTPPIGDMLAPK